MKTASEQSKNEMINDSDEIVPVSEDSDVSDEISYLGVTKKNFTNGEKRNITNGNLMCKINTRGKTVVRHELRFDKPEIVKKN